MRRIATPVTLALLAFAVPAFAQTTQPSPSAAVADANRAAGEQAARQNDRNANDQARYEEDRAAYLTALRSHNHNARIDARIYDRQQRAYADAMYAWRVQAEACRRGRRAACNAPTPDPANFW